MPAFARGRGGGGLLRRQLIELLGRDDLAVDGRILGGAAVGDSHQRRLADHGHPELGAVGGVDVVLVGLDVHLADGAGGDD
jgi:hypothetical protein